MCAIFPTSGDGSFFWRLRSWGGLNSVTTLVLLGNIWGDGKICALRETVFFFFFLFISMVPTLVYNKCLLQIMSRTLSPILIFMIITIIVNLNWNGKFIRIWFLCAWPVRKRQRPVVSFPGDDWRGLKVKNHELRLSPNAQTFVLALYYIIDKPLNVWAWANSKKKKK